MSLSSTNMPVTVSVSSQNRRSGRAQNADADRRDPRRSGDWRRRVAVCGIGLGLLPLALPASCFGDTLRRAIALAYQTNPELRAQRAELRAIDEAYVQAKAGFGPQIGINGGLSAEAARVSVGAGLFGTAKANYHGGTTTTTLSAVQPLYTSGQLTARLGEAEATVFLNRQNLRQVESRTLLATITAYVDVRRDRASVAVLQEELAALNAEGDETRARGKAGAITKTDVFQAESRLVAARIQSEAAAARLKLSEATYLEVVGESPGVLEAEDMLPGPPSTVDEALAAADANNAELLAATAAERIARRRVDVAKSAAGPTLSLRLDASVGPTEPYLQHSYQKSAAGSIVYTVPLFAAGLNQARIRQAAQEDERAVLALEGRRRKVVSGTASAWTELANAKLSSSLQEQQIRMQEEVLKGEHVEQRAGQRPLAELLNAELEVTSARLNLLQSRRNAVVAQANLLSAMGLLEARILAPGMQLYDPVDHLHASQQKVFAPLKPLIQAAEEAAGPRTAALRLSAPPPAAVRLGEVTQAQGARP